MNPTLGIDSDSHLQWGWQSAPDGFKITLKIHKLCLIPS